MLFAEVYSEPILEMNNLNLKLFLIMITLQTKS